MDLDRRRFITFAGMATAGFLAEGCTPTVTPQSRNEASRTVANPEASPIPEDPKQILTNEIHALPDSHIKTALQARVIPFMRTPTPSLVLSGIDLPITSVTVRESVTQNAAETSNIHATYTKRGTIAPTIYTPVADSPIVLPLMHILRPSETALIPKQNFLSDGTPFATIAWTPDSRIDKALAPEIVVTINVNGTNLNTTALKNLKTFGYIKEASTFLLDHLHMEATIKKMQQYNLPTHLNATDPAGTISSIPIIAEGANNIFRANGRSKAIMDLAGYVVGIKALAKSPAYQLMLKAGLIDATLGEKITNADLGKTPEDILQKSYEFVLNNPEVTTLIHQGNINQLP